MTIDTSRPLTSRKVPIFYREPTMSERRRLRQNTTGVVVRARILQFLVSYKIANDGNSPNCREIMEACGLSSTSVVNYHLDILERSGSILRTRGMSRHILINGGRWTYEEPKTNATR